MHTCEAAPWHALVTAAEARDHRCLPADLAQYLVGMLVHFLGDAAAMERAAWTAVGVRSLEHLRRGELRDLGDRCLVFTGLFADQAVHAALPPACYVRIGQSAYRRLGELGDPLFARLAERFVQLMDVLQIMRELDEGRPCLDALSAFQLWHETGSRSAWRLLQRSCTGLPAPAASDRLH